MRSGARANLSRCLVTGSNRFGGWSPPVSSRILECLAYANDLEKEQVQPDWPVGRHWLLLEDHHAQG